MRIRIRMKESGVADAQTCDYFCLVVQTHRYTWFMRIYCFFLYFGFIENLIIVHAVARTPEPMSASTSVDGLYDSSRRTTGASKSVYKSMFCSNKGSAVSIHAIFHTFCVIDF